MIVYSDSTMERLAGCQDVWELFRHLAGDWLIRKKIALQVAEGMLHASNLSRNVAKSRGSFYLSCNS